MTREAAGFILRRRTDGYLLLHSRRHDEWGFAKGHRDASDVDLVATARRELLEETGLCDIDILPGFAYELVYDVEAGKHGKHAYQKRVVYYVAWGPARGKVVLSDEHDMFRWCEYGQARELLPYDDLKQALDAAHRAFMACGG